MGSVAMRLSLSNSSNRKWNCTTGVREPFVGSVKMCGYSVGNWSPELRRAGSPPPFPFSLGMDVYFSMVNEVVYDFLK